MPSKRSTNATRGAALNPASKKLLTHDERYAIGKKLRDKLIFCCNSSTFFFKLSTVSSALDNNDEVGIDVDRAEIIHEHRDAEAVIAVEDAVEQRGLSRAKEAGEDRDGNGLPGRRWFRFDCVHALLSLEPQSCRKSKMQSPKSDATKLDSMVTEPI